MKKVLETLKIYYNDLEARLNNDLNNAGARSQVVVWNIPRSFKGDKLEFEYLFGNFSMQFPG